MVPGTRPFNSLQKKKCVEKSYHRVHLFLLKNCFYVGGGEGGGTEIGNNLQIQYRYLDNYFFLF